MECHPDRASRRKHSKYQFAIQNGEETLLIVRMTATSITEMNSEYVEKILPPKCYHFEIFV